MGCELIKAPLLWAYDINTGGECCRESQGARLFSGKSCRLLVVVSNLERVKVYVALKMRSWLSLFADLVFSKLRLLVLFRMPGLVSLSQLGWVINALGAQPEPSFLVRTGSKSWLGSVSMCKGKCKSLEHINLTEFTNFPAKMPQVILMRLTKAMAKVFWGTASDQ